MTGTRGSVHRLEGSTSFRARAFKPGKGVVLSLTLVAVAMLPLAGCFQHTFTIGAGAPDGELVYKAWHHHWLFGLIRPEYQEDVLVSKLCPSGNATIHKETTFLNGLVDVLIGFIYSPTTVTITCDDGSMASFELSSEDVAAIVTDPLFLELIQESAPERLAEVHELVEGSGTETLSITSAVTP